MGWGKLIARMHMSSRFREGERQAIKEMMEIQERQGNTAAARAEARRVMKRHGIQSPVAQRTFKMRLAQAERALGWDGVREGSE